MKIPSRVVEIATGELGVREIGTSNTGREVNRYLASVGLGPGYPWCAAFVYWCYEKACKEQDIPNPLPKSAYVPDYFNWANRNDLLTRQPEPGDLVVFYNTALGRYAHIGLVRSVGAKVRTVEGNTNLSGSRSGIGVFSLERGLSGVRTISMGGLFKEDGVTEKQATVVIGNDRYPAPLLNGGSMVPVRAVAESFGITIGWDQENNVPTVGTPPHVKPIGVQTALRQVDGQWLAYAGTRDLAQELGLQVRWDPDSKEITFHR